MIGSENSIPADGTDAVSTNNHIAFTNIAVRKSDARTLSIDVDYTGGRVQMGRRTLVLGRKRRLLQLRVKMAPMRMLPLLSTVRGKAFLRQ